MLQDTHPDHYWYRLFSEPFELGFHGISRPRTWVIGSHSQRSVCQHDPFELYDAIKDKFAQSRGAQAHGFLVASTAEIHQEAIDLATSRGLSHWVPGVVPLQFLLNHRESVTARDLGIAYQEKYGEDPRANPNLVFFLGDSAEYRSWSAVKGRILTYRLNKGIYWVPAQGRWLTNKERLVSMGFPVTPELAQCLSVPMLGARDCKRASDLVGQAMHFQTAGVFQLLALSCFSPR